MAYKQKFEKTSLFIACLILSSMIQNIPCEDVNVYYT